MKNRNTPPTCLPQEPIAATVCIPRQQPQISLDQALMLASQHQERGQLAEAEGIAKKILEAVPEQAHALHILSLIAYQVGKVDLAAELLRRAIRSNGKVAVFHANYCEMCRVLGRVDEGISHGQKAVSLDPKLISAHANLGVAFFDKKDFKMSEQCHRAALALDPGFAPSLNGLGSCMREKKDDEAAADYYRRAMAANPGYLEPVNNLGETLTRLDKPIEAVEVLKSALTRNPKYAVAQCNMGYALLAIDAEKQAYNHFGAALQLKPNYPEAFAGIARIYKELYKLPEAVLVAKKVLELNPALAEGHSILGSIYLAQGYTHMAKKSFRDALALDERLTSAQLGLGNILLEEGEIDEAEKVFREVANSRNERLGALFGLVQSKKVKPGAEEIELLENENAKIGQMPDNKALYVHFALGKVYDDLNEPDKAFPHFMKGCAIKRKKLDYDADAQDRLFASVKEVFSADFIRQNTGKGFDSDVPVFVLGMPRSGTTLTEQIIASHPNVFGAGEIFDMLELAGWETPKGVPSFPDNIPLLGGDGLCNLGKTYVDKLRARDGAAAKITDKMPSNFLHVGLIHLALPKAKIVHVSRHPLDTCISCFTRLFAHNQNNTYDLNELGRFYRGYKGLMDHWREVLPAGSFYDVRYENLIENTEAEAARLIDYCGLTWDESCLAFYENKRSIRTASVTQVRQPIYKTSLARWKKYEQYLGPLIEGLGEVLKG